MTNAYNNLTHIATANNSSVEIAGVVVTKTQLEAITATVTAKVAKTAKKSKTERAVVVLYSASEGTALVTTNIGFTGRTAEWIIADWRKTCLTSRPVIMKQLVNAGDVQVHISENVDCCNTEGVAALQALETQLCVHFATNNYNIISKVAKNVREAINDALNAAQAVEAAVVEAKVTKTAKKAKKAKNAVAA